MKRFLLTTLLTAGGTLAMHLINKRQSPVDFVSETVTTVKTKYADYQDWRKKASAVSDKLTQLNSAVAKAQPVIDSIQDDVQHFQFKIQPRLDKINETLDKF